MWKPLLQASWSRCDLALVVIASFILANKERTPSATTDHSPLVLLASGAMAGHQLLLFFIMVGRMEIEPTTPGLKDVGHTCCSILLAMELEHIVRWFAPDLYLMCCPVLGCGEKFVNKSVNKLGTTPHSQGRRAAS